MVDPSFPAPSRSACHHDAQTIGCIGPTASAGCGPAYAVVWLVLVATVWIPSTLPLLQHGGRGFGRACNGLPGSGPVRDRVSASPISPRAWGPPPGLLVVGAYIASVRFAPSAGSSSSRCGLSVALQVPPRSSFIPGSAMGSPGSGAGCERGCHWTRSGVGVARLALDRRGTPIFGSVMPLDAFSLAGWYCLAPRGARGG